MDQTDQEKIPPNEPDFSDSLRVTVSLDRLHIEWDIGVTRPFLSIAVFPGLAWIVAGCFGFYRLFQEHGPTPGLSTAAGFFVVMTLVGLIGAIYWMKKKPLDGALTLTTEHVSFWIRQMFQSADPRFSPLSETVLIMARNDRNEPLSLTIDGTFGDDNQRLAIAVAADQTPIIQADIARLVDWFVRETQLPVSMSSSGTLAAASAMNVQNHSESQ